MSFRLTLLNAGLRVVVRPRLERLSAPAAVRKDMARMARVFLAPPRGVTVAREEARGSVPPCLSVTPPDPARGLLLYFHGGGYIAGSPETHIGLLAAFAREAAVKVVAPRYRLAPEHPFPAAQEDALAVWRQLLSDGHRPEEIALAGDSAGGGLALSLLARLCGEGTPPAAVAVFSPWTDMTGSGPSCRDNARRDPFLPVSRLHELAGYALGGRDPRDPVASPLFADYPGCPPVFIAVSSTEVLRDDSLRLARRLEGEVLPVEIDLQDNCPHAWPVFAGRLPEADATVRRAADFLKRHMGKAGQRPACSVSR